MQNSRASPGGRVLIAHTANIVAGVVKQRGRQFSLGPILGPRVAIYHADACYL